jgi:hypothetical protein
MKREHRAGAERNQRSRSVESLPLAPRTGDSERYRDDDQRKPEPPDRDRERMRV